MLKIRRQFMFYSGVMALALVMSGCEWTTDKPISIAAHIWPGYEMMFLARNEGVLDTKLVNLVETASATESLQALSECRVDGAALTLDEVLQARSKGIPLSVVMIFDVSAGADVLMVRPGIKKLADLKGRRIGYESGALGALMLAEALRAGRLTKKDVTLVSLAINEQHAAWMRGQVDALVTYEPVSSQLLAQGAVRLFDSRQIPNMIVDVLAIRSDVLDQRHSAAIRHLVSAHFSALSRLNHNPHDVAYRMSTHMGLPEAEVLLAFKGLLLPEAISNRLLLTGFSPPLLDSARKVSASMVGEGLLPHDDPLTALIRADFLSSNAQ
jgi:NitT/TauT family transport system substrate-binding protein